MCLLSLRFSLHPKEVSASREQSESSLASYTDLPGPKTRWKAYEAYWKVKQAQTDSLLNGSEAQNTAKRPYLGVNDKVWGRGTVTK